jgi:hypothetical protein
MGSIYLLDLTEDLKPKGEPRPLTPLKSYLLGLAWTPDGRDIIFSFGFMADMSLWKVSAFAAGEPEPLPVTGEYPTISRSGSTGMASIATSGICGDESLRRYGDAVRLRFRGPGDQSPGYLQSIAPRCTAY